MDLNELKSLISNGETESVEYKKSLSELDKLGKSVCGQLNAAGGYGILGVTDAGKIIGVEVSDATKKKLTTFKNYFDPWPNLSIEYVPMPNENKQVIVIYAEKAQDDGPYTFRGKPYLKTPSGIQPMPSDKYKSMLLDHAGLSKAWEALPVNGYSIDDLDHSEIVKTMKIGLQAERIPDGEYTEDVVEILTNFDLINNGSISNAAMVLFAKKMPADYSQCFIRMGRFIDDTMDEVLDSKQMRGNAFQIQQQAEDFVRKHLPLSSHYDPNKFERIDKIALPLLAVREAIINSICHRDYSKRAGDISLYIYNDALEIHNIGHLYGGLTIDQLSVKHPSRRRNERIAQVFHARKLIDRFGGGTRRILKLCAEESLPAPQFSEQTDGFLVRFEFAEPIGPMKTVLPKMEQLTERQQEILQILEQNNELTTKEIFEQMEKPPSDRWLRDELSRLVNDGFLGSTGTTKSRKWFLLKR